MADRGEPPGRWQEEFRARAEALGAPLDEEALGRFGLYLGELRRWQAASNITGLRGTAAIVRDGFLDSLACLRALPQGPARVVDIGSGAGFPGLPLKIARPELAVTLVEARRRRHSFLSHVCRLLGLTDVCCLLARAEDAARPPAMRRAFDAAFARAVRRLPEAAGLAAGFLRCGGAFVAQQSAPAAERAPSLPGYGRPMVLPLPADVLPARALILYPRQA